jgi:sulfatase maturation enzyme AslB (radical SAM superfamily)
MNQDTRCAELWDRMYLSQTNNQLAHKPCCLYQSAETAVLTTEFDQIYHSHNSAPWIQHLRNETEAGRPVAGCNTCYHTESMGLQSSRQTANLRPRGPRNGKIDLNLGNLCNLACAICGPWSSSKWQAIAPPEWNYFDPATRYQARNQPVINDPELFLSLKTVQIQGGEPFMESNYLEFFANMGKYRDYSDLEVVVVTNGTQRPNKKFLDILNSCERVTMYFSIDDLDQRFEYQRHGAEWARVVDNMHWFRKQCPDFDYFAQTTYSMLNIFYLAELDDFLNRTFPWLKKNYNAFTWFPGLRAHCSATEMTADVRDAVLNKLVHVPELAHIRNYITVAEDPYAPFLKYIADYDAITNQSYQLAHPEFYNLVTRA